MRSLLALFVIGCGSMLASPARADPPPGWPGAANEPVEPTQPSGPPPAPPSSPADGDQRPASPPSTQPTYSATVTPAARATPAIARPTTADEYARVRRRLKEEIKTAERHDREVEAKQLREQLDAVNDWYREDVERVSTGGFVSGIVLTSVGGASLVTGLGLLIAAGASDASNADRDLTEGLQVAADVTLLSGVVLAGVGIPLMIWGGEHVMANENAAAPRPRYAITAQPGGVRFVGSF